MKNYILIICFLVLLGCNETKKSSETENEEKEIKRTEWNEETPKPEWYWWDPEPNTLATQWRTTPSAIDWNKDGLMDLVMLDQDGYLSYYERFKDGTDLMLKPGRRIFNTTNGTYDRKNKFMNRYRWPKPS